MLQFPEPIYDQVIPYDKAVAEGKVVVFDIYERQWRLGELALRIEPKHGAYTLEKFAEEIGINYGTLKKIRSVVRAWPQLGGIHPIRFGVANALMAHPNRMEIVRENPRITIMQARELVKEYRADLDGNDDEEDEDVAIEAKSTDEDDHLDSEWLDNFIQMSKYSDDLINNWASRNFPENEKGYILSLAEKAVREWTSIVDEIRRSM